MRKQIESDDARVNEAFASGCGNSSAQEERGEEVKDCGEGNR